MVAVDELIGRSLELEEHADEHRARTYRSFMRLEPTEPMLTLHWTLFTSMPRKVRQDGHATTMAPFPPLPWPRRMWAGGAIKWRAPIAEGERLQRRSVVSRASLKNGRSGEFLLGSLEHTVAANGDLRLTERQDVVFLPDDARPGAGEPLLLPSDHRVVDERVFDEVALFRFSALTLNSHRIHYDARYAREREGYEGLVVHGPLLASLLVEAGRTQDPRSAPRRFDYRAVAPSIAGETLRFTVGDPSDGQLPLAVSGAGGDVRMTATMRFGDDA